LKVLYLVNTYPRTSHTFIRREIRALEELGHEVVRVSVRPLDETPVDAADQEEARKTLFLLDRGALGLLPSVALALLRHPIRFGRAFLRAWGLSRKSEAGWLRHMAYFAEACALARIASREHVSHVHAHFGTNPPVVALLAQVLGAPGFSFTVHGPEEFDRPIALKLAEKVTAARFVVAISSFGRAQLQRYVDAAFHARIHVVACGLDSEAFAGPSPVSDAGRTFLFVGRLSAQKQPLLLVDAAVRLVSLGVPFRIRIGGTGELREALASRIREAGLGSLFDLLGPLDGAGVRREMDACRTFVLPSAAEGLPVVLMEALARERPVISTFVAGIPELVRPGREGWLVPAGDVDALTEAMSASLAATPDELRRLGASGSQRVRERHDVSASARILGDLFERHAASS
jgi:colanic acid/amylovoran biosynthesis glycosyltransferase